MPHRHAEHNRRLVLHLLSIRIDDHLVAPGNLDLALQVKRIVLKNVNAHIAQINVRSNADTAHRYQRIQFNCRFQIQLVCDIFEDIQRVLPVGTLGPSRQSQRKQRIEIRRDLPVHLRRPMVAFVNYQIAEVIRREYPDIRRHALNAAAHDIRIGFPVSFHIPAGADLRPELSEAVVGLVNQLLLMSKEQGAFAQALGIRDNCHRFARSCDVIKQHYSFIGTSHGFQLSQGFLLMFVKLKRFSLLGWQRIFDIPEHRRRAQKRHQFILDPLGCLLDLSGIPAVDLPALIVKAVLLEQIVVVFFLRYDSRLVPSIAIYLDGDTPSVAMAA